MGTLHTWNTYLSINMSVLSAVMDYTLTVFTIFENITVPVVPSLSAQNVCQSMRKIIMFSPGEKASWSSISIYQATDRKQCFTVKKKVQKAP